METEGMELEIIINPKTTDDGQAVIQVFDDLLNSSEATLIRIFSFNSSRPLPVQPLSTSRTHMELTSLVNVSYQ